MTHITEMAHFQVVILGDSRVRDLESHIYDELAERRMWDISLTCFSYPGATCAQVIGRGLRDICPKKVDLIYLMAGVNDLSSKIRGSRHVTPLLQSTDEITQYYSSLFQDARRTLSEHCEAAIICELPALSYSLYNRDSTVADDIQTNTDLAMIEVNYEVRIGNHNQGLFSPNIGGHFYKSRHGKRSSRYASHTTDGIHYNLHTKKKLTRYTVNTIYPNIHQICN